MKLSLLPALVVGSICLTASLSNAQTTTTGSMAVSAFIGQECTLSATNMDFGRIVIGVANRATSTISLDCLSTPTSIASVLIDSGQNTGPATRNLNFSGTNIPYVLSLLVDGTELTDDNDLTLVQAPLDSTLHTIVINGKIPELTILPSQGSYVDNVVITAIYNR